MATPKRVSKKSVSHEEQMRQTIKEKAFELMAQKGLDNVSMREIAQKLKVTKPVLYYYFKNKEDLCSSIIEEYTEGFVQKLSNLQNMAHGMEEVIKQACQIQRRFFAENSARSRFVIQMLAYSLGPSAKALARRKSTDPHVVLQRLLQEKAVKEKWSAAAINDMRMVMAALSAGMMLNAYFRQHLDTWIDKPDLHQEYTQERLDRLVHVMLLGIKAYYKGKK